MQELIELVRGRKVALIGSVPPDNFIPSDYDFIVRCNDWWSFDEGACDILFHIGSSPKIKPSWLLGQLKMIENLKLLCLFSDGAEAGKMQKICKLQGKPVMCYTKRSEWLRKLRSWFELRGNSPSTGLQACFMLCLAEPSYLYVTGMNLYCKEPDHTGWMRHGPLAHCVWYRKLTNRYSFLKLDPVLWDSIAHWEKTERDAVGDWR